MFVFEVCECISQCNGLSPSQGQTFQKYPVKYTWVKLPDMSLALNCQTFSGTELLGQYVSNESARRVCVCV